MFCEIRFVRFGDPFRHAIEDGFRDFRHAFEGAHPRLPVIRLYWIGKGALNRLGDELLEGNPAPGGGGFRFPEKGVRQINSGLHD